MKKLELDEILNQTFFGQDIAQIEALVYVRNCIVHGAGIIDHHKHPEDLTHGLSNQRFQVTVLAEVSALTDGGSHTV